MFFWNVAAVIPPVIPVSYTHLDVYKRQLKRHFKTKIGIMIETEVVYIGDLPRSEKKTARVIDKRYC